jgi:hypothetical protein
MNLPTQSLALIHAVGGYAMMELLMLWWVMLVLRLLLRVVHGLLLIHGRLLWMPHGADYVGHCVEFAHVRIFDARRHDGG